MKTERQIKDMINILKTSYKKAEEAELSELAKSRYYYGIALKWVLSNEVSLADTEENNTMWVLQED